MNFKKLTIFHICVLGIVIKLFFFCIYQPWDSKTIQQQVLVKDAREYHEIGVNLLQNQVFNSDLPKQFESPELRTPLYPYFITAIYFIFGKNPYIILLTQIILDAVTCFFIYKIAFIKFSKPIAYLAAIFYTLDPFIVVYSLTMYSDIFFSMFIVISIYWLILFEESRKKSYLILSSVTFGLSILVRPVAFLLLILLPLYILFYERKFFSKHALLFFLFSFLTLTPWFARNLIKFDKWSLSTSGEYNLLILFAAPVVSEQKKIPIVLAEKAVLGEANKAMLADGKVSSNLNDFQKAPYWNKVSVKYIKEYPAAFFKHYFVGIIRSFWNLDTRDISQMLHLNQGGTEFETKGKANLAQIVKDFFQKKSKEEIILACLLLAYLIFSYFFGLLGVFFLFKHPVAKIHILLSLCILYFIFISGTGGLIRFRIPTIPFMSIFSGIGLYYFYEKVSSRSKRVDVKGLTQT